MFLHCRLVSASIVEGHAVERIRERTNGRMDTHWRNLRGKGGSRIMGEGKVKISCSSTHCCLLGLFMPSGSVFVFILHLLTFHFLFLLEPLTRFLSQAMAANITSGLKPAGCSHEASTVAVGRRQAGGED